MFTEPDGKVVVADLLSEGSYTVTAFSNSTSKLVLERFNADGSPDTTFGTAGRLMVPIPFSTTDQNPLEMGGSLGEAIVMQPNGQILAAGFMPLGTPGIPYTGTPYSTYAVIRINVDGTVNPTYGTNGLAVYPAGVQTASMPGLTSATTAALQPDGKLVLGEPRPRASRPSGSMPTGRSTPASEPAARRPSKPASTVRSIRSPSSPTAGSSWRARRKVLTRTYRTRS